MVKTLQKYYSVVLTLLLVGQVAFAQVDKGKSRLDIGKKPVNTVKKTASLNRYVLVSKMPKEVKYNSSAAVNQFYKSILLTTKAASLNDNTGSQENRFLGSEANDRLFANEKISVSNIYPNPANDYATIDYQISGNVKSAEISFHNLIGGTVDSFELDKFDRRLRVQTSHWDSGIYFYKLVVDGKNIATKKLLVSHN